MAPDKITISSIISAVAESKTHPVFGPESPLLNEEDIRSLNTAIKSLAVLGDNFGQRITPTLIGCGRSPDEEIRPTDVKALEALAVAIMLPDGTSYDAQRVLVGKIKPLFSSTGRNKSDGFLTAKRLIEDLSADVAGQTFKMPHPEYVYPIKRRVNF